MCRWGCVELTGMCACPDGWTGVGDLVDDSGVSCDFYTPILVCGWALQTILSVVGQFTIIRQLYGYYTNARDSVLFSPRRISRSSRFIRFIRSVLTCLKLDAVVLRFMWLICYVCMFGVGVLEIQGHSVGHHIGVSMFATGSMVSFWVPSSCLTILQRDIYIQSFVLFYRWAVIFSCGCMSNWGSLPPVPEASISNHYS
jgi:hypothetical protein